MKTDLYTKIILTVIAVVLTLHLVKDINFVGNANAAPLPMPFAAHTDGVIDVNIVQVNGYRVDNLPVKVKNESYDKIPVEIKNSSPVEIKLPSYAEMSVNVKNTVEVKGSVTCK